MAEVCKPEHSAIFLVLMLSAAYLQAAAAQPDHAGHSGNEWMHRINYADFAGLYSDGAFMGGTGYQSSRTEASN